MAWNTTSYPPPYLLSYLKDLKDRGLIDEIIKFEPSLLPEKDKHNKNMQYNNAVRNEVIKRNIGLQYAKKAGCDYFYSSDCDEFYRKKELEQAKGEILFSKCTHSYCPMIYYGILPTQRFKENIQGYVPFFAKISRLSKIVHSKKNKKFLTSTNDPTRNLKLTKSSKPFYLSSISMHHMAFIRKDLSYKFKCSSNIAALNMNINTINFNVIDVEDEFNIYNYCDFLMKSNQ